MSIDDEDIEAPVERAPSGRGGFALGLLVGAMVGAAVGLLLAPDSGRVTRRRLRRRLGRAREALGEQLEDIDARVRKEIRRRTGA